MLSSLMAFSPFGKLTELPEPEPVSQQEKTKTHREDKHGCLCCREISVQIQLLQNLNVEFQAVGIATKGHC